MRLSLSVIGAQAQALGDNAQVCWVDHGGTIGRAENNDWTLPDPRQEISRCHARIRFAGGRFYLEDASANGIYVDDPGNRMSSREMLTLENGQRLFIGDYEIHVSVAEGEGVEQEPPAREAPNATGPPSGSAVVPDEESPPDPLDLLGGAVETPKQPPSVPDDPEPAYLKEHFRPAPVQPDRSKEPLPSAPDDDASPPGPIPTDWWRDIGTAGTAGSDGKGEADDAGESSGEPSSPSSSQPIPPTAPEPTPVETPQDPGEVPQPGPPERPCPGGTARQTEGARTASGASTAGASTSQDALERLLAGAGIDPAELTPETAETLGRVLHVAVDGLMDLLRARMEIKNEFRMSVTLIQSTDNNPLKFSTNVQDAMHNLLVKDNPDYLGPEEAFHASFDDLRFHQMALLAGMREAFFAMIERFDPDNLETQFSQRQQDSGVLGRMGRRRYWEQYRGLYDEIRQDTEGYFNRLFGEAFVEAYERQMDELKQGARQRRSGGQ
ncbi:type VI secretion system-associated FHA domain protein TagH [Arhodomonas sp. SL1]|uniref:type VI secretion system-associated FHA domain protein TagH n=1 Tax=Arhodomonas sp. SL1 TaxID=3425691 RepID=UPI003F8842AC